jgi:glycosyltransferase involved in cell wall biosynthesis
LSTVWQNASATSVPRTRVLYFVGSFEQGGAERQVAELVSNLPHDRFEPHVAVCSTHDDYGYELPVASFTDLGTPRGPNGATLRALVRLVRTLRPDVIHSVHDPQNAYARIASRVAGSRCAAVGSLRCTHLPRRTLRREWWTHRLGGALIVNSRGIRDELRRAGIERVDVIENGVDGARFVKLGQMRNRVRERFGMTGLTLVLPARIAEQKNQVAVVEAVAHLQTRGEWPRDAKIVFAGRAHTAYVGAVDRAIQRLGGSDAVRRVEPVRDAESLLGAADAVILPSRFEGLPNVVLESLACETPVIVSRAANHDAVVTDGATGFVSDCDPPSIAHAFRRFFDATPSERTMMAAKGRAAVLARFSISRMVDSTCAVYDRVA